MRRKLAIGTATFLALGAALSATPAAAAEDQARSVSAVNVDGFADELCRSLDLTYYSKNAAKVAIDQFQRTFPNLEPDTPGYEARFMALWNDIAADLICTHDSPFIDYERVPQHYMKRVIEMKMSRRIFYDFLLNDYEAMPIDVNMLELVDGTPETLLDFMDELIGDPERLKNYEVKILREIRDIIILDYGAKKASELQQSSTDPKTSPQLRPSPTSATRAARRGLLRGVSSRAHAILSRRGAMPGEVPAFAGTRAELTKLRGTSVLWSFLLVE